MTDLTDLLSTLSSAGWLVNNCYQVDAALWRVNIRRPTPDGNWFTDWAEGPTMIEALEECMSKLLDAEFVEDTESVGFAEPPPKSLTELLNIHPKSPPIPRRF